MWSPIPFTGPLTLQCSVRQADLASVVTSARSSFRFARGRYCLNPCRTHQEPVLKPSRANALRRCRQPGMLGPMTKPDHSDSLANWSLWFPFVEAVAVAPRLPGVYMAKDSAQVVYVGMAAERRGQGIRGRLTVYRRGRAAVSGLGEAAMDRALRDPDWLRARLEAVEKGADWRTRDWAAAALEPFLRVQNKSGAPSAPRPLR
jgi:hypothetical protein